MLYSATDIAYNDFRTNPNISKAERKKIAPYLLPYNNPLRPILDSIFCTQRATFDATSFKKAGFTLLFNQPRSFIKVGSHPLLPNHLVKVYFDTDRREKKRLEKEVPSWRWLAYRVEGAKQVQRILTAYHIKHFVVPKKWIYPLPPKPFPTTKVKTRARNCILIVENMNLASYEENLDAWKNRMTKEHLDELFTIIKFAGGGAYRADNVALTKSGKFALIDTEYPYKTGRYHSVESYLSDEMLRYWRKLVRTVE